MKSSEKRDPWMDGSVWFAIDCSIPPDGQLASIDFIAKQYAEEMRKENLTKFDYYQEEPVIQAVSIEPDFAGIKFGAPFASNAMATDTWKMVRIGLVGSRVRDIEICRLALQKAHVNLVAKAVVRTPFKEKFKINLEGMYENGGDNGNVLKAHVMLAELNAAGITKAKDIIDFLVREGAGSQVHLDSSSKMHSYWSDSALERGILFEQYAKIATEYVRHGYKWLIHSQNPPMTE